MPGMETGAPERIEQIRLAKEAEKAGAEIPVDPEEKGGAAEEEGKKKKNQANDWTTKLDRRCSSEF